jgi:hypothetical protein
MVRGACGALPSWMIDNVAEALHALVVAGGVGGGAPAGTAAASAGAAGVSPAGVRALRSALRSGRLPVGCQRASEAEAGKALAPLLAAKDRREWKRRLKAMCGGKKKGSRGAPPPTRS